LTLAEAGWVVIVGAAPHGAAQAMQSRNPKT